MARSRSLVSVRRDGDTRVEGLADLQRRSDNLPPAVQRQLQRAVKATGRALVRRMKSIVPREKGDLADSIVATEGDGPISVRVSAGNEKTPGKSVEHGHIAVDGTPVQPVPFFWVSYHVEKKGIRSRMVRAVNAGFKEGLPGGSKS